MRRRGTVLVAVLVIVAVAALAASALMYRSQAEITACVASSRRQQAYAAAMSGLRRVKAILEMARNDREMWYDNPELFQNQLVWDDGSVRWYFSIYAYNPSDPENIRNGLTDEAGKININFAPANVLLGLPNMTAELVDCLIDYRDQDEETSPEGAEQDYYDQLPRPYLIKNGPLATVEELLLVRGFNGPLVYGEDHNLNGLLEINEDDAEGSFPPDNSDGLLDRGLLGVATVWSYELNVTNDGQMRTNASDPRGLGRSGLPRQTVEFLELYAAEGNKLSHPAELLEMRYQLKQNQGPVRAGTWIESGVGAAELPDVLDRLTTEGPVLIGKVNVSTAPRETLAALPGFDEELADRVIGARQDIDPSVMDTVAWLYTENVVDADRFKEIAPSLTARSYQFSVRCVAYGWPVGQFRVIEAVIDTARGAPRVVYQRDLTRLGLPYAVDAEQQESMK
jgi:type II secretory pathway component PulK